MKLLIASDIHGSVNRSELLLDLEQRYRPDAVVLLGDLLYHGPRNALPGEYDAGETAGRLNQLKGPVIAVNGNCDAEVDRMLLAFALAPLFAWILLPGLRILATHGHASGYGPADAPSLLGPGDAFLSGHTHVPQARVVDGVRLWNPGSMTLPKQNFPPSYALFADGLFSVRDLDGGVIMDDAV